MNLDYFPERLKELITMLNMNNASFSEAIHVPRSSISHIMSGRNKPSLEFVLKIVDTFPEIEINWLLGINKVVKPEKHNFHSNFQNIETSENEDLSLFSNLPSSKIESKSNNAIKTNLLDSDKVDNESLNDQTGDFENDSRIIYKEEDLEKIIFFYKDGSFKVYTP